MIAEVNLYGIYVPWLLLLSLLALASARALVHLLARLGFYRLVWHPALFDFALFIILLGGFTFLFPHGFF
jgi:hypothetical protein